MSILRSLHPNMERPLPPPRYVIAMQVSHVVCHNDIHIPLPLPSILLKGLMYCSQADPPVAREHHARQYARTVISVPISRTQVHRVALVLGHDQVPFTCSSPSSLESSTCSRVTSQQPVAFVRPAFDKCHARLSLDPSKQTSKPSQFVIVGHV